MDQRLQEMLDHYEIRKLIAEYCQGVDRMDQVRIASVYSKESWDNHGPVKCSGQDIAVEFTQLMKAGVSKVEHHTMGQTLINIKGDDAGAETYFIAMSVADRPAASDILHQMGGRYIDILVREDGRWKIKHRICVRDWSISLPVDDDRFVNAPFVQARRSNDDPCYAVLGIKHSGIPGETKSAG